jgi:hypothetical protein
MRQPPLLQRLRAKKRTQALLIGVTWYTKDSWAQIKATAIDPDCFETSYEKWKTMAVKAQREFLRSGVHAIQCHLIPEDFFAWCSLNNQENSATSRAEFVSVTLQATPECSVTAS